MVTGIKPASGDWDTGVSAAQWRSLLHLADVQPDTCAEASQCLDVLSGRFPLRKFLLYVKQIPQYRWCSLCLAGDNIPYLRWEWRLIGVSHCSIHRVPLHERCGWCNSALQLHKTLLVSIGPYGGVPDLATCGSCGMSLCDRSGEDEVEHRVDNSLTSSQALMEELLERVRPAYQSGVGQLMLDFGRYADVLRPTQCPNAADGALTNTRPARVWVDTCILRFPAPERPPLLIDGAVFRQGFTSPVDTDARVKKWSQFLRPADRARLAVALRSIRREENALRRQGELSPDAAAPRGVT